MDPGFNEHFKFLVDKLYEKRDEIFDFVIFCNGSTIHCHKIILATSSPVFNAMIKKNMKEGLKSEVTLDQISVASIDCMLKFMYLQFKPDNFVHCILGSPDDIDFIEVLRMAEYFQIENLKVLCEYSLINLMKPENALEYFKEAKENNADNLMNKSKEFILEWIHIIMKYEDWKDDLRKLNDVELMLEILDIARQGRQGKSQKSYVHGSI